MAKRCAQCIIEDVARSFSVTRDEMVSACRDRRLAYPRFAAFRLLRDGGLSMTVIGRMVGRRNHTSVRAGLLRADELLRTDPEFAARYEEARG